MWTKTDFRVLDNMTSAADYILECISTELNKEKNKPLIISWVYKTPASHIELFKDWMETRVIKPIFICGDFSIDLLNPNKHKVTDELINAIYRIKSPDPAG